MKILILLLTCLLISVVNAAEAKAVTNEKNWQFKVYLDDSPIGYHYYNLKQTGDSYQVSTKAEFDVKFLYISVYNYLHNNLETWHGQCLTSLTSSTDDNGTNLFVKLSSKNKNQIIETQNGTLKSNDCLRSFAYWDPKLLDTQRLLNSQTGELIDIDLIHRGNETINLSKQIIDTERYQIKGKDVDINIWYSSDKEWIALQAKTQSGYILRYERESLINK